MNGRVRRLLKALGIGLGVLVGIFLLMQLVPYGRTHRNPLTIKEPDWDSPRTRELARRACFDCHSNKTHWPWYADVAPFSWVVQHDVDSARNIVNFSEWNRHYDLAEYSGYAVRAGSMPPRNYVMAHPEANLTAEETRDLARGLDATIGTPSANAPPQR